MWLPLACALLLVSVLASAAYGATDIPLPDAARLLLHPDDSMPGLVIHTLRLPRTAAAALSGAGLGVSGLLFQAVTRNPLADPGLLGVEAGGGLALLLLVIFFPLAPGWLGVPVAFAGGTLAATLAYAAAHTVGITPLRLALSGVAVASLVGAVSRSMQILFEERAQGALFVLSGSVAGRTWEQVYQVAPWVLAGLAVAWLLSVRVNILNLGDDVARSLGSNTQRDALMVTALGVLLAAASVGLVGPLGFVGLIVPHAARALVGADHRLSLPLSALLGASLLILADVAARLVARPAETPVGLLIAALGAPFFIALARRVGQ